MYEFDIKLIDTQILWIDTFDSKNPDPTDYDSVLPAGTSDQYLVMYDQFDYFDADVDIHHYIQYATIKLRNGVSLKMGFDFNVNSTDFTWSKFFKEDIISYIASKTLPKSIEVFKMISLQNRLKINKISSTYSSEHFLIEGRAQITKSVLKSYRESDYHLLETLGANDEVSTAIMKKGSALNNRNNNLIFSIMDEVLGNYRVFSTNYNRKVFFENGSDKKYYALRFKNKWSMQHYTKFDYYDLYVFERALDVSINLLEGDKWFILNDILDKYEIDDEETPDLIDFYKEIQKEIQKEILNPMPFSIFSNTGLDWTNIFRMKTEIIYNTN